MLVVVMLGSNTVFATQNTSARDGDLKFTQMSLAEAQEQNLSFIEVETAEDAAKLFDQFENMPVLMDKNLPVLADKNSKSTLTQQRGDAPYELRRNGAGGKIVVSLFTRVTTSGSKITSTRAYTGLSGWTMGLNWKEYDIDSIITPDGKDFRSWVDGGLTYGISIKGTDLVNLYTQPIYMEDYRMLFR